MILCVVEVAMCTMVVTVTDVKLRPCYAPGGPLLWCECSLPKTVLTLNC